MRSLSRATLILASICVPAYAQSLDRTPAHGPKVPFEVSSGFVVVVKGQIGGLNGLRLILDTGTTYSMIDRRIARKLRLEEISGSVINFERRVPVEWADIPDIQIGAMHSRAIRVMVANLTDFSDLAKSVDGIIGLDLLTGSKKLTFDFAQRTVCFETREVSVERYGIPRFFMAPLVVQGVPLRVIVDTGFQGVLLYKTRIRARLPNLLIEGKPETVTVGRMKGFAAKVPGLQIGGVGVDSPIWLMDDPLGGSRPEADGIWGPISMHPKWIEFDFDAQALSWR